MEKNNLKKKKKILIVEDERHIAEGVKLNLNLKGYQSMIAPDGLQAIELWKSFSPDLVVLDLMLPHLDGFGVLKKIRLLNASTPIMVLSARFEAKDKIKCFELGVDDYLCKPFNLEEFLLRVERLLKRAQEWQQNIAPWGEMTSLNDRHLTEFAFGKNRIDFQLNIASNGSKRFKLTAQEAKLLKFFILNKEVPLSRQIILEMAFGYQNQDKITTRTIDAFIVRFRKYFEVDSKSPVHFKSLRSVGYVFQPAHKS